MTDLNDLNASQESDLVLEERAFQSLFSTAKWAKFLSIIGFIGVGILVLFAFAFTSIMNSVPQTDINEAFPVIGGAFITFIYLAAALLYFYPVFLLYRFATRMEAGLRSRNQKLLNEAFDNQRSLFKFLGILIIIILGIYVFAILGGLLTGLALT